MPLPREENESRAVGPKETRLLPVWTGTADGMGRSYIYGEGKGVNEGGRLLLTLVELRKVQIISATKHDIQRIQQVLQHK